MVHDLWAWAWHDLGADNPPSPRQAVLYGSAALLLSILIWAGVAAVNL